MGKAGKQLKHTRVLFFLLFSFWQVIPKATAVSDSRMESGPERLDELRGRMKFQGTVDEFILFLRNDLRFKLKSPEEMGGRMTALQAKAGLTRFFSKIPQTPCSIKRLDPALENFAIFFAFP